MRQKTFKVSDLSFEPKVGQEVILISRENVAVRDSKETFSIILDPGEGVPGNMDHSIKRYHGWRGTTDDVALYAHGLRQIVKVENVSMGANLGYKITVGKDLHPEWD